MKTPHPFSKQVQREWILFLRQPGLLVNAVLFFVMIVVFFPLTMPADKLVLKLFAPGLVWMAMILAVLLASERLFQQDYDDGFLELWVSSGSSLTSLVTAKIIVHGLLILLPLLAFSPFFAVIFGLSWHESIILLASISVGLPAILSLCALAAAFSVGMQQKGVFMALILLPLTIPIMIFGAGALSLAMQAVPALPYLAILAALSLLALSFLPLIIAAVLRLIIAG